MSESMWVGKDEHEGVRAQARKDVKPPSHWRLEAIAQTPRPHSLTVRGRTAVFIQAEAETSDVWLLDLEGDGEPERLTTGREPVAYWDDTHPASPRTARPSPTPRTTTCGSCRPPAARRASSSRARARCGSTTRAWSSRSSATTTTRRAWPWSTSPTRGRGASPSSTATSTPTATRARPPSRPTPARSPTPSRRAPTSTAAARSASRQIDGGAVRAVTGTPRHARQQPRVVAGRRRRSPTHRSAAASTSCTLRALRTARSPAPAPTTSSSRGTRTAGACSPSAGGATASTS